LQQVVVEQDFSPFYARRLAVKMGLLGGLIQSVSTIVEKMYHLFVQKDLDLVEINPLGVSATGELMALDGKVTVNEQAIARHPDITAMAEKIATYAHGQQPYASYGRWNEVEKSGNIAILGNGAGLLMSSMDLLAEASDKKPAACLNVGHGRNIDPSTPTFGDRIEQGLEFLSGDKNIQVILINILSSVPTALEVAEVVAKFVQRHESASASKNRSHHYPHLVVRLAGSDIDSARKRLAEVQVSLIENLDEAVDRAVRQAKPSANKR